MPWRASPTDRARGRGLLAALAAVALLGALSGPARGEPARLKRARFRLAGGVVTVTVGFRELFDAELRRGLRSGFPTRVVMRVAVYPEGSDRPVATGARTLTASYDIWGERFSLVIEEASGVRRRVTRSEARVVDVLTSLWRFPAVAASRLEPRRSYFVALVVEVNPMSERLLAEVRRWLRKPRRARRVGGDSLFGSFVSFFVNNKVRRAERTLRLRTQPFYLPGP